MKDQSQQRTNNHNNHNNHNNNKRDSTSPKSIDPASGEIQMLKNKLQFAENEKETIYLKAKNLEAILSFFTHCDGGWKSFKI